jgi:hypothetical protein
MLSSFIVVLEDSHTSFVHHDSSSSLNEIQGMFASQTRARAISIPLALGNTRKEDSSVTEYFGKMKQLGEEMAAARADPISVSELFLQLLNFEIYVGPFFNDRQHSAN